jgi:GNAT superfamily N-acetyltransferase
MAKLPQDFTIRPATHGDIPQLVLIELAGNELFTPTGLIPPEQMDDHVSIEWHQDAIEAGMSFVVTNTDDFPVGFTLTSLREPDLYLDEIAVHPDYARQGLGSALLGHCLERAKDLRVRSVSLSTFRNVPWNGPFYKQFGFRELPQKKWTGWMHQINAVQAETLDVTERCFMRRQVKRSLLG